MQAAHFSILAPVLKSSGNPSFQNGFFKIDRSRIAGWGAFASRDLQLGDVILHEIPLFVADLSTVLSEFRKLDARAQEVSLSLFASGGKPETPLIRKIWDTNCFTLNDGDLAGLFPIAARFNHACNPANNIDFAFDRGRGHLTLTVRADRIAAGEEMTISYGSGRSALELYVWYGFRCRCGACGGLSDEELERFHEAQW